MINKRSKKENYIPEDIPRILVVIPARGGSKAIPMKNMKLFCGYPLIWHVMNTVRNTPWIDRAIVSTDSEYIRNYVLANGFEAPFIRPAELATDDVSTLPVILHAVNYVINKCYTPDYVMVLYPTSPLLSSKRISDAVQMLITGEYDSVISVYENYEHHWKLDGTRLYPVKSVNRQLATPIYTENGAIYAAKTNIIKNGSLIGNKVGFLKMDKGENVDINNMTDFRIAEFILNTRRQTQTL